MQRLSLILLLAFVFGCARERTAPPQQAKPLSDSSRAGESARPVETPAETPTQIKIELSSDVEKLSANEQRALHVAEAHLKQDLRFDLETVFSVTEKPDEYRVFLQFIGRRNDDGSPPVLFPGGHTTVIVSPEFNVIRVIRGE